MTRLMWMPWSAAILAVAVVPGAAHAKPRPCEAPETVRFIALLDTAGDPLVLLGVIQTRMTTEQLDCWATRTGDKALLMALGERYERGDGVAADSVRVELLYTRAAAGTSGTTFIYQPKVGKLPGRTIPIRTGPDLPGLPGGDLRRGLMHIEGRAAKSSYRRGMKLVERAAKAGYAPAQVKLAELTARRA